jgi:hypothetical protein
MPQLVEEQLAKAQKATYPFERIEIWSRPGDPIAVGVIEGEQPRYFSIVRWGDAKVTIDQVKRTLRIEKWMLRLISVGMALMFFAGTWVAFTHAGQFPQLVQTTASQGSF